MKNCLFHFEDGLMAAEHPDEKFLRVVTESFQVFECTWMRELDNAKDDQPGQMDGYKPPYRWLQVQLGLPESEAHNRSPSELRPVDNQTLYQRQ